MHVVNLVVRRPDLSERQREGTWSQDGQLVPESSTALDTSTFTPITDVSFQPGISSLLVSSLGV